MKIFESCIRFLDECNFFATSIPRCALQSPESIVEAGIEHPDKIRWGISVSGWTRAYVPDVLLGFVDEEGRWYWADAETCCGINLHRLTCKSHPPNTWPVWLTIADVDAREKLRRGPPRIDLLRILQRYKCARFWERSFEEFIRTTWHPSRLQWCLDVEDYQDFFHEHPDASHKKNQRPYHVHGDDDPRRGELSA